MTRETYQSAIFTQKAIVEVMTMRLLAPQALEYLKNAGHEMSRSKYSEDS